MTCNFWDHKSGIEMAKLAEKQASNPELKSTAGKMIQEQQGDIKQLQQWKSQWYPDKGDAVNLQMHGMAESMKGMPEHMKQLSSTSGKKFDTLVLKMKSKHHAGAIQVAKVAQSKAEHQKVKDFATKVISTQGHERAQMQKMKKELESAK